MLRITLSVLLLFSLFGCGKADPAAAMVGKWRFDIDALKETEDYKKAPDAEKLMMEGMMGGMKIEITKDTVNMTMSMLGQEQTDTSKYTVKGSEGNLVTVEIETAEGEKNTATAKVDGDKLVLIDDTKKEIPLVRVKE